MALQIKYSLDELLREAEAIATTRNNIFAQIQKQKPIIEDLRNRLAEAQAELSALQQQEQKTWEDWQFVLLLARRAGVEEKILDKGKELGIVATPATSPATVITDPPGKTASTGEFLLIYPDGRSKKLKGRTEAVRRFAELTGLWNRSERFDGHAICSQLSSSYRDFIELNHNGYTLKAI